MREKEKDFVSLVQKNHGELRTYRVCRLNLE